MMPRRTGPARFRSSILLSRSYSDPRQNRQSFPDNRPFGRSLAHARRLALVVSGPTP